MTTETFRSAVTESRDGALLRLHLQPGARRTAPAGWFGDALKIAIQAPPVDGKANAALRKALSGWFNLPIAAIEIKTGEFSRDKLVLLRGRSAEEIIQILNTLSS